MFNIKISIRNLVEFVMRSGNIDNRRTAPMEVEAMNEGSRIHRKIQSRMGPDYKAEVPLVHNIEYEGFTLRLEGRADGIITDKDGNITIDEIKGVYTYLDRIEEPYRVHLAQARCYGYIYAMKNGLDNISIQLTYCNMETEEIKRFVEDKSFEEISKWFNELIEQYIKWARYQVESKRERNQSIRGVEFPFEYREGQRDVVVSVYRAIARQKRLFVQAPTGIGKTISTVYPAIMSMGEGLTDKIFYLTAKTITRTVAEEAFGIMREAGVKIKNLTITAKEKICPLKECVCNPDGCERANGHFDRVNDAIYDMLIHEANIDRETIIVYAGKHNVCPFEMSLDVSMFVDAVICDYNYVFDPNVYLKRYFSAGVKGDYVFLIDEAHNLVERAREMYSAQIVKEDILKVRKIIESVKGEKSAIIKHFNKCNRLMLQYKREWDGYRIILSIDELIIPLMRIQTSLEKMLDDYKEFDKRDEVLDFYFTIRNFLSVHDLIDENYEIYSDFNEKGEFIIKLFCINPSVNLRERMDKGKATILFSATFLPITYYKRLLSGDVDDYAIYVKSPFDTQNRLIVSASDVSSKYTRRNESEYRKMYQYINRIVSANEGNYIVFFPSYKLMYDVHKYVELGNDKWNKHCIMQSSNMNEKSREEFLAEFDSENNIVGFCVLGGVFSEGIDLKGESLIGSIIIGTGLPQVCTEREILKNHFDNEMDVNGFDYSYRYPGMNKVLQAAGRVIRTNEDEGVIALLDERFMDTSSRRLFPEEWNDILFVNMNNIEEHIERFWEGRRTK